MPVKALDDIATSVFCEDLAMMLAAGIPNAEAIDLMAEDVHKGALSEAIAALSHMMRQGSSFSDAIDGCGYFPRYCVDAIVAGETSGRTESSLRALSSYYEEQAETRRRFRSAVIYPSVLLVLMAIILGVMVFAVIPTFVSVYESLSGSLAASSYGYIQAAQLISRIALVVVVVCAVVSVVLSLLATSEKSDSGALSGLLEHFPGTSRIARQTACARFCSILDTYVESGLNSDDAFEKAIPTIDNRAFAADAARCFKRMQDGAGMASAIYDEKLFDPVYARLLISGSRSGQTDRVLGRLSSLFFDDARSSIDGFIDTIEPLLAGILTLAVALSLVAIMLPLIGIMGGIG